MWRMVEGFDIKRNPYILVGGFYIRQYERESPVFMATVREFNGKVHR